MMHPKLGVRKMRQNGKLNEVINIKKITYNHKYGNGASIKIFSLL